MAEKSKTPASFEEAISRLENIVEKMESGEEDLDSMVEDFEEGQKLVKFCSEKLKAVERKVEILTKKADGSVEAQPFKEEL